MIEILLYLLQVFLFETWETFFLVLAITIFVVSGILLYLINLRYTQKLERDVLNRTADLDESEKRYRQMFEENQAIMLVVDPDTNFILNANYSAINYYGMSLTHLREIKLNDIDYLYSKEYNPTGDPNSASKRNYYISKHKISDGTFRDVEIYMSVISLKGKDLIFAIVHDIDSKRKVEEARKETEERYSKLIEQMMDGVAVIQHMRFVFVNSALANMIGLESDSLINVSPRKYIHRLDFENVLSWYRNFREGFQNKKELELRLIHSSSGNSVYVQINFNEVTFRGTRALLATVKNITIRKKQEEQLRKLSTAVEQSPNSVLITNLLGEIEYINPRFSELTGYSLHEIFKENPRFLKSNKMEPAVYKDLWDTIISGNTWRGELLNKRKNDENFWVSAAINPIKDEFGVITHFLAVEVDITFQKYAQEQIHKNQHLLDTVLNTVPVFIFSIDKNYNILFVKGSSAEIFGVTDNSINGKNIKILFNEYDDIMNDLEIASQGRQFSQVRKVKDHYLEIQYIPAFSEEGDFRGISGIAFDFTERYVAQAALIESEERFRGLYENSSVGIYRSNPEGQILLANPTMLDMLGYSNLDELRSKRVTDEDFNVKVSRDEFIKRLEKDGIVKGLESVWVKKDSGVIYVRESARAVRDQHDRILYFDGIIEDITERKMAEQELVKSEAKNRAMLNAIPDQIFEINSDGAILSSRLSKSQAKNIGLPVDIDGYNIFEIVDPLLAEQIKSKILKALESDEIQVFDFTLNTLAGIRFFEARIIVSGVNSVITILRDITERKETEKILIKAKEEAEKSDKLKSEFLAQMSHEIRTPINSILSFTSLIKEELEDKVSEDLTLSFNAIDKGGHRLIRTIDSILNMSQLQSGTYQASYAVVDIDKQIIESVINELMPRAREKNLNLNYSVNTNKTRILGDMYTLGQIFVNLIDNAIKYTNQGCVDIEIKTNNESRVTVEICDTGIGISKNYIPNLFVPFSQEDTGYTRKYEGNGLGLALVKRYCQINHASIKVNSEKGKGTRFTVVFHKTESELTKMLN